MFHFFGVINKKNNWNVCVLSINVSEDMSISRSSLARPSKGINFCNPDWLTGYSGAEWRGEGWNKEIDISMGLCISLRVFRKRRNTHTHALSHSRNVFVGAMNLSICVTMFVCAWVKESKRIRTFNFGKGNSFIGDLRASFEGNNLVIHSPIYESEW